MNTPADPTNNPALWACRRAYAASLLRGNFADNVLREARLARARATAASSRASRLSRFIHNPFALSGLTAAACLAAAVIVHTQTNNQASEQNLAGWRDIVAQTASLDPL